METDLEVTVGEEPGHVRICGELDAATAGIAATALEAAAAGGGDVVVDVSGLTFIDSTGIRLLLLTCGSLEGRGTLVLRSPVAMVQRVIDLTGLEKVPNLRVETMDAP